MTRFEANSAEALVRLSAFTNSHRDGVNFHRSMLHGNMELSAADGRLDEFGRIADR